MLAAGEQPGVSAALHSSWLSAGILRVEKTIVAAGMDIWWIFHVFPSGHGQNISSKNVTFGLNIAMQNNHRLLIALWSLFFKVCQKTRYFILCTLQRLYDLLVQLLSI